MPPSPQPDNKAQDIIDAQAQDWLLALSSGEADRAAFARWRDADPRHAAAFREIQLLWRDLAPLESSFAHQGAGPARRPLARHPVWRRRAALALLPLCALAVLIVRPSLDVLADHHTRIGQRTRITLADGSQAHLNSDTALDVEFSATRRRVVLRHGEALFEVRKDAARPFQVQAASGTTTAVGTAFAVRDTTHGVQVAVTEGRVRVETPHGGTGRSEDIEVAAGQGVQYRPDTPPVLLPGLDVDGQTAWVRGYLSFHDQPLEAALAEIERYRPGRILLWRSQVAAAPVSARIALDDLDDGIDALATTQGLSVTRLTPFLVVVR